MEIVSIAVFVIAIAFAIVACYLSFVLSRLAGTIRSVGKSVDQMEEELKYLTPPLLETLQETDRLLVDIDDKVQQADGLVDTAADLGTSLKTWNDMYADRAGEMSTAEFHKKAKPFVTGLAWSEAAAQLIKKWKAVQKSPKHEVMIRESDMKPATDGRD